MKRKLLSFTLLAFVPLAYYANYPILEMRKFGEFFFSLLFYLVVFFIMLFISKNEKFVSFSKNNKKTITIICIVAIFFLNSSHNFYFYLTNIIAAFCAIVTYRGIGAEKAEVMSKEC